MTGSDVDHRLDHIVVLMFENRSFDNLLGYLYQPGEVRNFEGVAGRDLSNPIPADALESDQRVVPVHPVPGRDSPDPDPGEEHPHTNTQLYGTVLPAENRGKRAAGIVAPFNAPSDPNQVPTMDGFVTDYVDVFQMEMGRAPSYHDYAQIMGCYTPEQTPVLSTLAREFAVFDHWFCEVPSQTYPNRSFFHAASSSGFVLNAPAGEFPLHNSAETIFDRLETAKLPWKVYYERRQVFSATELIHARRLTPFVPTHFFGLQDFFDDAKAGRLPAYSFIEPSLIPPHNDMHPPGVGRVRKILPFPLPSPIKSGEALLARIYDAVRTSASPKGSNFLNTLLLVTFDEHGGTYDHVPPPKVPPPDSSAPPGQMGFRFDRSGVRVPTLAISAWVDPKTVVNAEYRHTSVIQTLRRRWSLGDPLTGRDAAAADIAPVLSRTSPRRVEDWPTVLPRFTFPFLRALLARGHRLPPLGRDLVSSALATESGRTGERPEIDPERVTRGRALRHLQGIRTRRVVEAGARPYRR